MITETGMIHDCERTSIGSRKYNFVLAADKLQIQTYICREFCIMMQGTFRNLQSFQQI